MKPLIVGQAPARSGDGTPFSGRSGNRLCQLLGVTSVDDLKQWFELDNLIPDKLPKRPSGRGDMFHVKRAERHARELVANSPGGRIIIACGRQVWTAFGCDLSIEWFGDCLLPNAKGELVVLKLFPHPSGLSHFWNDHANVQRAADALKAVGFSAYMMRRIRSSQRSLRSLKLPQKRSSRASSAHHHAP